MTGEVGVLLVGAGGIARRHVDVLAQLPLCRVVGVADVDGERAAALAGPIGAAADEDLERLADRVEPDAMMICVPPSCHGAPEVVAIERGLPFFVEKPVGLDLGEAEEIAAAAAGIVTAVGYHWRCLDGLDEVAELLREHPPGLVNGFWLDATPPVAWWWQERTCGGQIVEQMTHVVDTARHLLGEIETVTALTEQTPREMYAAMDVPTSSAVVARFARGPVGTFTATCLLGWQHRVGLHFFSDGQAIELSDRDLLVDIGRGRQPRVFAGDPVLRQDRAFLAAVRGEGEVACTYNDAVDTLRVTLAMAASACRGEAVDLRGGR